MTWWLPHKTLPRYTLHSTTIHTTLYHDTHRQTIAAMTSWLPHNTSTAPPARITIQHPNTPTPKHTHTHTCGGVSKEFERLEPMLDAFAMPSHISARAARAYWVTAAPYTATYTATYTASYTQLCPMCMEFGGALPHMHRIGRMGIDVQHHPYVCALAPSSLCLSTRSFIGVCLCTCSVRCSTF